MNQNGFITFEELMKLMTYLHCLAEISGFEKKIQKITAKKGLKNKKDIITKEIFQSMVNEYGQIFDAN